MFKNFKKLETFVIVAIIAVIGIIYAFTKQPVLPATNSNSAIDNQQENAEQNTQQNPTYPDQAGIQQVPTTAVRYQGEDGKNALDLLKAGHQVEVKHYSFGDMVIGIDGLAPDPNTHFWSFYVNGQASQVGASAYVTKSSDLIEWKLEKINM